MSRGHVEERTPFFFNQRSERIFQRRLRKTFDDASVFGDRSRWGEGENATNSISSVGPNLHGRYKHLATSGKRVALSEKVVIFPQVDRDGPNLVSSDAQSHELSDKKSTSVEKTGKNSSQSTRKPTAETGWSRIKDAYRFDELKFGSTSIISNLAKALFSSSHVNGKESVSESIPEEFIGNLLEDHQSLISDVVVEKRKWQTDCYQDLGATNKQPFLTRVPSIEEERKKSEDIVAAIARQHTSARKEAATRDTNQRNSLNQQSQKKQERHQPKRVTMSQEVTTKWKSTKRPLTARSTVSILSFHSDYSQASSAEDGDLKNDYDILPAELRPSILLYRRESQTPKVAVKGPRTRLEKFRSSQESSKPRPRRGSRKPSRAHVASSGIGEKSQDGRTKANELQGQLQADRNLLQQQAAPNTIKFSVGSPEVQDKGWLVHPTAAEDPEMATLLLWDRKTKERLRQREEEKMIADGSLLVKFYSDSHTRSLRSKHQRSATFPIPAIFSKLPPSMISFTAPSTAGGDAMMIGEGPQLAILIHPDGFGHANYYNSRCVRQAVCQSRTHIDNAELCTVAYDDTEAHPVLACFSPSGRGWAYYPGSRTLQMIYDRTGGKLFNENGHVTKKWVWPSPKHKLPVSISLQFNSHLFFHCTNLNNMVLRFSCRGQQYRFNVSPPAASGRGRGSSKDEGGFLQSGMALMSDSAQVPSLHTASPEPKETQKQRRKTKKDSVSVTQMESVLELSVDEEGLLAGGANLEKMERELATYRERIKTTTNDWMSYYRQSLGITPSSHLRSSSSSSSSFPFHSPSPYLSRTGSSRQVYTAMGFVGEAPPSRPASRPHFFTHPLPPRVHTPFEAGGHSPDHSPTSSVTGSITSQPSHYDHEHYPPFAKKTKQTRKIKLLHVKSTVQSSKRGCPVCDKRKPPYACDLEYDTFLQSHVPSEQVVVVCVLSSLVENSCVCEPMLDALHYSLHRQHFSPCTQSALLELVTREEYSQRPTKSSDTTKVYGLIKKNEEKMDSQSSTIISAYEDIDEKKATTSSLSSRSRELSERKRKPKKHHTDPSDSAASASKKKIIDSKGAAETASRHDEDSSLCKRLWVAPNLRVRIVDTAFRGGKFYNSKVVIVDVISGDRCVCQTNDGRHLEGIRQSMLETLVPKTPGSVMMLVGGKQKGQLS